jgi:hypothetical protein
MARQRGCDGKPAPKRVELETIGDKTYVYWNCPKKFIPLSLYRWHAEYEYHKKFSSAPMPAYKDIPRRFISAINVYEDALSEYEALKQ